MQDALIQRLAEKDSQYYGEQISGTLTVAKSAAAGAIRDVKFLDTETCFWQLTQQQTMQHKSGTADLVPHLGDQSCLQPHMQAHMLLAILTKSAFAHGSCKLPLEHINAHNFQHRLMLVRHFFHASNLTLKALYMEQAQCELTRPCCPAVCCCLITTLMYT